MCVGVPNYSFCLEGRRESTVSSTSAYVLPSDVNCQLVWTSRVSEFPQDYDGACLQMRLSYSPAAHIFLLPCAVDLLWPRYLLRILIYKVCAILCPCKVVGSVLTAPMLCASNVIRTGMHKNSVSSHAFLCACIELYILNCLLSLLYKCNHHAQALVVIDYPAFELVFKKMGKGSRIFTIVCMYISTFLKAVLFLSYFLLSVPSVALQVLVANSEAFDPYVC